MFAQIEIPGNIYPEELDTYLANGWFRMRQTVFTTNFLHFKNHFYAAIWLRVALNDSIYDPKFYSLKKINKRFSTEIKRSAISGIKAQHELLFQHYRKSIAFDISLSLRELLFGNEHYNKFDTYEINIYDGSKIIAVGFFDLGKFSAAGITCIYEPAYKKYSLGKYLMYLKMDFCKKRGLHFFYPGYTVPGYKPFDYKLEIGKYSLEYLQLSTQQWIKYAAGVEITNPLRDMIENLARLKNCLSEEAIPSAILYYKFFEANLDPYYNDTKLFDFPVFLHFFPAPSGNHFHKLVVYDIRDNKYSLLQCSSVISLGFEQIAPAIFDTNLLRVEHQLFSTAFAKEMAFYLSHFKSW